ncbi:MAG: inositol monophosphatase family protein [Candidatus Aminicenantes bacterium]|jgi:myo-inositol-1(or 4)-monophosphatase
METYLRSAKEAAMRAGELLRKHSETPPEVHFKGAVDLVTDLDNRAQNIIYEVLSSRFPDFDFLAEEDLCEEKGSVFRWIIDPLDGTTNYAHNFPVFCVSVALEREGEVVLGVIYDPMREEMFCAVKGQGARLNEKSIRVSSVKELDKSLLATGFPYDLRTSRVNNVNHFVHFVTRAQGIRRGGSAALDLCYVACGRFDGFWELKLQPWDVAAGGLIAKEAGGHVSDFLNGKFDIFGTETLATNGHIHEQMVDVLRMEKRGSERN